MKILCGIVASVVMLCAFNLSAQSSQVEIRPAALDIRPEGKYPPHTADLNLERMERIPSPLPSRRFFPVRAVREESSFLLVMDGPTAFECALSRTVMDML